MTHIMRVIIFVIALTLSATNISAQSFALQPQVDLSPITNTLNGFDYVLSSVEAAPWSPGKEVLFWVPGLWQFSVGRWHPTKHGVGGTLPGAGLCLEPWNAITIRGAVWHFQTIGDFLGGDGIDDFLIYLPFGSTLDPYQGLGLSVCK